MSRITVNYLQSINDEIKFTNRILNFDRRHWARRETLREPPQNTLVLSFILIQSENHAYLRGIRDSVKSKNLRAAGTLLRSLLESTANAHWISLDKSNKRADRYYENIERFDEILKDVHNNRNERGARIPKEEISWTTSSVEDRLIKFSPQAGFIWDYCSVFTHASPSFAGIMHGRDKILDYMIGQANTYAVTTRHIIRDRIDLFNKTEQDYLIKIAQEILNDVRKINNSDLVN